MNRHEPTLGDDALERLFFAVDLLMFLESISTAAHKTARFMGTSIHFPVLVHSHVLFQIAGGDRRVAAARHGTFKRLFAGVGSNVDFQVAVVLAILLLFHRAYTPMKQAYSCRLI